MHYISQVKGLHRLTIAAKPSYIDPQYMRAVALAFAANESALHLDVTRKTKQWRQGAPMAEMWSIREKFQSKNNLLLTLKALQNTKISTMWRREIIQEIGFMCVENEMN